MAHGRFCSDLPRSVSAQRISTALWHTSPNPFHQHYVELYSNSCIIKPPGEIFFVCIVQCLTRSSSTEKSYHSSIAIRLTQRVARVCWSRTDLIYATPGCAVAGPWNGSYTMMVQFSNIGCTQSGKQNIPTLDFARIEHRPHGVHLSIKENSGEFAGIHTAVGVENGGSPPLQSRNSLW